ASRHHVPLSRAGARRGARRARPGCRTTTTPLELDATPTSTVATISWSIQGIARIAGTTSRTLRHYEHMGLLVRAGRAPGGARRYDQDALVRLQRILLLRDLDMGLTEIGEALRSQPDAARALTAHREQLRAERDLVERRLA